LTAVRLDGASIALGGRTVLSRVTLAVEAGAFVGLLGPNGSGKTTLMRAILGLQPLASGTIRVLGQSPRRGNPAIGYMPQLRRGIGPSRLSGWAFLASAANGHRWGPPYTGAAERRSIQEALALVEAEDLARRPLEELSGGERQRLLLAQSLLGRPALLLLDEPLVNLDPRHQGSVVALVRRLQRELGITVLFSAHELNPLLGALDRVLYLGSGQAALGKVEDVITGPVLSRLYGSQIEVVRAGGHIFVMSGGHDVERSAHRHDA